MLTSIPLHDWSVGSRNDDPYRPPETAPCLQGRIDPRTHPSYPEGGYIRTSTIVAKNGCWITTSSGHVYELLEPAPGYLAWLKEHGYYYDPYDPIGWGPGSRKLGGGAA